MNCPFCAEPVEHDDLKCKSCGESLDEDREVTAQSGSTAKTVLIVVGVLAVVAVLGCVLFSFLVGITARKARGQAMRARAMADMHSMKSACQLYKVDTGRYPQQLSDLTTNPGDNRWRGPYMMGAPVADPWGNPYVYSVQGGKPVFTTYGADGVQGGTGDAADAQVGP